ncbi:hypothetical protein F9802_18300 [Bacillus aerolatus]|uniref:SLH domain-containing protein n=1 Tax=Bacillus aerolatus TaxID=2653354 RepID=A0A6I1FB01_9BACI|nr:S-layer homology domain-containing protein [Bacillus aerolatus]KAB7704241.1 hypothetical protein F9802_18300 [Bacillus aerolatus]
MKKVKHVLAVTAVAGAVFTSSIPLSLAHAEETDLPPLYDAVKFLPFTDVPLGSRYVDGVHFVYTNGIAQGLSATKFGVSEKIKRVDAAVLVGNYIAVDVTHPDPAPAPFKDVPKRAVKTISALREAGIINGKTETSFGSHLDITRGEAAILLSKAFDKVLKPASTSSTEGAGFTDVSGNSGYQPVEKSDKFTDVTGRYVEPVHRLFNSGIT